MENNSREQLAELLTIQKETIYRAEKSSDNKDGLPGLTIMSSITGVPPTRK